MTEEEKIKKFAHWYFNANSVPRPIIPFLKEKFGHIVGPSCQGDKQGH